MDFSATEETTVLAVLVRQRAATGSDLRIDRLDGWQNPQASSAQLCWCYTLAASVSDGNV